MKKLLLGLTLAVVAVLGFTPITLQAGGGGPPVEVNYDVPIYQISLREAELLWKQGVPFYDTNLLEIWADGYVPGAIYLNVKDWEKLLPKDKDVILVVYSANKLCDLSQEAARKITKLGYKNVLQMADGIDGWKLSGRPVEKP